MPRGLQKACWFTCLPHAGGSRDQDRPRQSPRVPHPKDPDFEWPAATSWRGGLWAGQQEGEPHLESAGQHQTVPRVFSLPVADMETLIVA